MWVNHRDREDFLANDILLGREAASMFDLVEEPDRQAISVFHQGHGCTILAPDQDDVLFEPVPIHPNLPDASQTAWPLGDVFPSEPGFFSADNHHFNVYFEGIDVSRWASLRDARHPPGTVGSYRNSDPLTLGRIVRETLEAHGEDYLTFPQRALFDRIGARNMVLERDPWGNAILSGFDHGTARDYARFGLLHEQDGVLAGERVLPEGWVDLVSTPAPGWKDKGYGGQFWLNAGERWPGIPTDTFMARGAFGQATAIIRSHDLVVARIGYSLSSAEANLVKVLTSLVEAVSAEKS